MTTIASASAPPATVAAAPLKTALTEAPTYEELFASTNFSDRDAIVKLFPSYIQEQHQLAKTKAKNVSRLVHIEPFTLKTPFGDQTMLSNTELHIEPTGRQCLYGPNSSGKTLLFEYIRDGKIKDFPKHLHVHHCKELEQHELGDTVLNTVVMSHPYRNALLRVEEKLISLVASSAEDPTATEDYKTGLKDNLNFVSFAINTIRGRDAEDRAKKMLRVLGFDDIGQQKLVNELSGGLKMRVALCMAFFIEADLLLLDEPTNHLDFPSVLWLENRLRGYKSSFILVSHDRELLNNVCTCVLLIEDKQLKYYTKGFKEFEKQHAAEDAKKFAEIEKFLEKNRNADPSTMLGRQKADKKEWSDNYYRKQIALAGKFTFPSSTPLDNPEKLAPEEISLINLQNVRFSYKPEVENPIFIFNDPISFNVTASTRVGVMGPNGAGKSTLLKLLTEKIKPTTGTVTPHSNYTLAYFGQHSTAELVLEQTPMEFMADMFPTEQPGTLRNHLSKTGVAGPVAETRMERLSFSQRSCVIFAKLTFVCPHLLILDEPTNFLDLESVDSLIGACNKYKGALLLVSHNRDFLRKCAKGFLSVVPGHFALYDNLKAAERATYTFIAEMEEGGDASAAKSALANNPGGGSVHASQVKGGLVGAEKKEDKDTIGSAPKTVGAAGPNKPAATATATPATPATPKPASDYKVGETVEALWTDGKWYTALIKNISGVKITVTYSAYGNTAALTSVAIRPLSAAAQAALSKKAPPAAGKGGAKPQGQAKPQQAQGQGKAAPKK